jgi:putative endonuclease
MTTQKQKTYDLGLRAESYAALWLRLKGYKILAQRYKTHGGEIDIIARKGNSICFIEVKARPDKPTAMECITPKMRARIEKAAMHYISHNNVEGCELRFDVIAIYPPFFIHHLDNAWQQAA